MQRRSINQSKMLRKVSAERQTTLEMLENLDDAQAVKYYVNNAPLTKGGGNANANKFNMKILFR